MDRLFGLGIAKRWARPVAVILVFFASWMEAGPLHEAEGSLEFAKGAPGTPQAHPDFMETQIEMLQSGELYRRALDAMRIRHPELKETEITIRGNRPKDSQVVWMFASGADEKYTQLFLEAVMQEFLALRKELLEKKVGAALNLLIEDVLAAEKRVKHLEDDRRVAKVLDKATDMSSIDAKLAVARASFGTLKKKMDELVNVLKTTPPDVEVKEHSRLTR